MAGGAQLKSLTAVGMRVLAERHSNPGVTVEGVAVPYPVAPQTTLERGVGDEVLDRDIRIDETAGCTEVAVVVMRRNLLVEIGRKRQRGDDNVSVISAGIPLQQIIGVAEHFELGRGAASGSWNNGELFVPVVVIG